MKDMLKQLLTSKKFAATLVAIAVWCGGRFGLDVQPDLLLPVVGSLTAYVVAQGFADKGKEAEKEKAKNEAVAAEKDDSSE